MLFSHLLEKRVDGHCLSDHLQDPRVWVHGDHLIRSQEQGEILKLEDIVELVDELESELLLLEIIPYLHHQVHKVPSLQTRVYRLGPNPVSHLLLLLPKDKV